MVQHQTTCILTVVDAVGNASTTLSVDIADILLQAGVCNAASASGNRAVGIGALGDSSRKSGEGEDDGGGGGGELHVE